MFKFAKNATNVLKSFTKYIVENFSLTLIAAGLLATFIFEHKEIELWSYIFKSENIQVPLLGSSAVLIAVVVFISTSITQAYDKSLEGGKYLGRSIFAAPLRDSLAVIFLSNYSTRLLISILFISPLIMPVFSGHFRDVLISLWVVSFSFISLAAISITTSLLSDHAFSVRYGDSNKSLIEKQIIEESYNYLKKCVHLKRDKVYNIEYFFQHHTRILESLPPVERERYLDLTILNLKFASESLRNKKVSGYSEVQFAVQQQLIKWLRGQGYFLEAWVIKGCYTVVLERWLTLMIDNPSIKTLSIFHHGFSYGRDNKDWVFTQDFQIKSMIPGRVDKKYNNIINVYAVISDSVIRDYNIFGYNAADYSRLFQISSRISDESIRKAVEGILLYSLVSNTPRSGRDFEISDIYYLEKSMVHKFRHDDGDDFFKFESVALQLLKENLGSSALRYKEAFDFISPSTCRGLFLEIILYRNRSYRSMPEDLVNFFLEYRYSELDAYSQDRDELAKDAYSYLRRTNVSHFIDKESISWLSSIAGDPLDFAIMNDFYRLKNKHLLREFHLDDLILWIVYNRGYSNYHTSLYSVESVEGKGFPYMKNEIESTIAILQKYKVNRINSIEFIDFLNYFLQEITPKNNGGQ